MGFLSRLAHVAFLLHATLRISQTAKNLWYGRTHSLVCSIGEIIALAMNSTPTEKLRNTCAGIHSLSWLFGKRKIDRIILVFEDGSDDEQLGIGPQPGKEYGQRRQILEPVGANA